MERDADLSPHREPIGAPVRPTDVVCWTLKTEALASGLEGLRLTAQSTALISAPPAAQIAFGH
jgi:hypothetical protein